MQLLQALAICKYLKNDELEHKRKQGNGCSAQLRHNRLLSMAFMLSKNEIVCDFKLQSIPCCSSLFYFSPLRLIRYVFHILIVFIFCFPSRKYVPGDQGFLSLYCLLHSVSTLNTCSGNKSWSGPSLCSGYKCLHKVALTYYLAFGFPTSFKTMTNY